MKKFPARIHVVLAANSRRAVVFRRGPSKRVCTLLWDRSNDSFTLGQWLQGRIYERRSDISPDGKHLIYFAMNGRWDAHGKGSWTAISRAPWLKALVMLPKGDCWNGGGLFTGDGRYWLNDAAGHRSLQSSSEVQRDECYQPERFGGECTGVYYPRLQRDGWKLKQRIQRSRWDKLTLFEKDAPNGWVLRKLAHEQVDSPVGKGCYWDEHLLLNKKHGIEISEPEWEWLELDANRLVYAANGCLFRRAVTSAHELGPPDLLYDFNGLSFASIPAPY